MGATPEIYDRQCSRRNGNRPQSLSLHCPAANGGLCRRSGNTSSGWSARRKSSPTLEEGIRRLQEYTLPLEDARAFKAYGYTAVLTKLLIVKKEVVPAVTTMILVKENLGF